MHNGFAEAKRQEQERQRQIDLRKSINHIRFHKAKLRELSDRAAERRDTWLAHARQNASVAQCMLDSDCVGFNEGALPLKHDKNYEFRTREHIKELSPKEFHNYTYKTDKEKSEELASKAASLYFNQKFDPKTPNTFFQPRDRTPEKEIQPLMHFTDRNTKDRVRDALKRQVPIELEPIASKVLFKPRFRSTHTDKWLSKVKISDAQRGFIAVKSGVEQSWEQFKNTEAQYPEQYVNGMESLGETLIARQREPEKEITKTTFSSIISNDPWRTQITNSSSIRSYHAINSQMRMRNIGQSVMQSTSKIRVQEGNRSTSVPPRAHKNTLAPLKGDEPSLTRDTFLITALDQQNLPMLYPQVNSSKKKVKRFFSPSQNRNYAMMDSLTDRDFSTILDGEKTYMQSAQRLFKSPKKRDSSVMQALALFRLSPRSPIDLASTSDTFRSKAGAYPIKKIEEEREGGRLSPIHLVKKEGV